MARILIVDDDPSILALLKAILEREGHIVAQARDGRSAKELFLETSFDLLVTDIVLPEKEGLDLILELQKERPGLRAIAISGGDRIESAYYLELASILGANGTLSKPFSPSDLVAKVRMALGSISA